MKDCHRNLRLTDRRLINAYIRFNHKKLTFYWTRSYNFSINSIIINLKTVLTEFDYYVKFYKKELSIYWSTVRTHCKWFLLKAKFTKLIHFVCTTPFTEISQLFETGKLKVEQFKSLKKLSWNEISFIYFHGIFLPQENHPLTNHLTSNQLSVCLKKLFLNFHNSPPIQSCLENCIPQSEQLFDLNTQNIFIRLPRKSSRNAKRDAK